ncbi:MAG TPA: MotA/TolQ/ExbB proton channel family protein [Woeseiaceae bacterium]|nr:MotA/TolQ/ExbB proton channel family protein [Woeseiaceae bacterium]
MTAAQGGARWTARLRLALFAGLAAAMLLPAYSALAQDDEAEERAAQQAAEAAAKKAAEERRRQQVFAQLQQEIQEMRAREAELLQAKEAQARQELADQQEQTRQAIARRDRAEAHSKELDRQWEANEARIDEITALLEQHQGNLGELFGVTRQIAGDAAGVLRESLITTQLEPPPGQESRYDFMVRIAAAKALPSIQELERLWFELVREMTMAGEVVRYQTDVIQIDEDAAGKPLEEQFAVDLSDEPGKAALEQAAAERLESVPKEVLRVGSFTAITGNEYLGYLPSEGELTELDGQLAPNFRNIAGNLFNTQADAGYTRAVVDPASGALLGVYLQRPNWLQRIALGEVVGYVIIAVGILGVLLAVFQYAYLIRTRIAVRSQLQDLSDPKRDNPLGRLLLAFRGSNGDKSRKPESIELAELRLSEAALREVPKLERFQAFLRLAVAAGPLLGLIGTVIGMIITFHAIVASGTSDPRLMAHGIGQAMIATVLGLGIAIPLLFINAGLTAFSRGIMQTLDEQSELLLADTITETRKRQQSPT